MTTISELDYRTCPRCELGRRLIFVEPRQIHREDAHERHLYRCGGCGNDSRFVFELPSRVKEGYENGAGQSPAK